MLSHCRERGHVFSGAQMPARDRCARLSAKSPMGYRNGAVFSNQAQPRHAFSHSHVCRRSSPVPDESELCPAPDGQPITDPGRARYSPGAIESPQTLFIDLLRPPPPSHHRSAPLDNHRQ